MKNIVLAVVIIGVLSVGVWYFMNQPQLPAVDESRDNSEEEENVEDVEEGTGTENIITFTDNGFSPSILVVQKGEMVTFVNDSSDEVWPASAMHPTHKVYPGSDIEKCGTSADDTIFDACEGLAPGESWEFTFNEVGEWAYHDHLAVKFFGKVIVE